MRAKLTLVIAVLMTGAGFAQVKDLKPGFNLFSSQQDVALGREAAAEVARKQPIVHNSEINNYLTSLVRRLARSPHAATEFPFSVQAISDKSVNAFALPGGPLFVYTGLISLADDEAQLAGVLAHEMSHIRLRHGTSQASKANLFQLPLLLAGGLAGDGLLGQLSQLGLGLGTGSVLLKMSRTAETQADYNGAQIMAEAGYNPIAMAQLFEKLDAQEGQARSAQFLSDHPNPGNRVKALQEQIQQMLRRGDTDKLRIDTGDLVHQMQQANPGMRANEPRSLKVNGDPALVTTLNANSPFQGETEIDQLVTVLRPEGLWYLVFISPQSESRDIEPVFDQRSIKYREATLVRSDGVVFGVATWLATPNTTPSAALRNGTIY